MTRFCKKVRSIHGPKMTINIDPIKYRGDDGDEPVPEWLIKKYEEKIGEE